MHTSIRESISPSAALNVPSERTGPLLELWRRFRRRYSAMVGLGILLLLILLALAAPVLTSHDPEKQDLSHVLRPPSAEYPLGTDYLGRDILARLLYGARLSLLIGFMAVAIGLVSVSP